MALPAAGRGTVERLAIAFVLATVGIAMIPAPASAVEQKSLGFCKSLGRTHFTYNQATLGHARVDVFFANTGRSGCRVDGYPKLTLLDRTGHPLDLREVKGADSMKAYDPGPHNIDLRPGQSAVVAVTATVFGDYGDTCAASQRGTLRVDGTTVLVPRLAFAPCSKYEVTAATSDERKLALR